MYLADVAKRVILVVLFDQRATLGLVKLKAKSVVGELNKVFAEMFNRVGTGQAQQKGLLEGAEDEIDKLFGKGRSEEHTSELQSPCNLVCRLLLEKKKQKKCN